MNKLLLPILVLFYWSCSTEKSIPEVTPQNQNVTRALSYAALGDSYTIGESVCTTCRFPEQLKAGLQALNTAVSLDIVAQTGWTTTNLKTAISQQLPATNYDLVTLLIGVNNQYQNKPFALYEQEFPELVTIAIAKARGLKQNVIVVSIPDYAFTPFGVGTGATNQATISAQLDNYNTFAQNYCLQNNITFVTITDITRQGLITPSLVASDGLHPSQLAYSKFVERIVPLAKLKLGL